MDPESTTAPDQDTPLIDSAPDEGHAQEPQVDYAKRYNDLRPEFDRTKQQLANYESQLAAARQGDVEAIRALGFEYEEPVDDPTPDDNYEDPYAPKFAAQEKELAEIKAWKQQVEADKVATSIRSHVDSLSTEAGVPLTDRDKEIIFSQAVAGDQISADQTEAAFKAHVEWRNSILESVEPKPTPARPGTGQAASKQPDLDNPQERRAWMKAQLGL